jgi:hypothetical protein
LAIGLMIARHVSRLRCYGSALSRNHQATLAAEANAKTSTPI